MLNLLNRFTGQTRRNDAARDDIRAAIASEFDADFYVETYRDVAEAGSDPLDHYIRYGAREGRDPSARFSTSWYLQTHPDVRESGMNPLHHYVLHGRAEGRAPVAEAEGPAVDAWIEEVEDLGREIADVFDRAFYLRTYPDLDDGSTDPLRHYLVTGAQQGNDPAPWFSTRYYLDTHDDVRRAGVNPLVHYVRAGRAEGRLTRAPGGFRAEALRKLEPLDRQVLKWRRDLSGITPLGAEALAKALWREGDIAPWMVLSFSHDDYLENTGGIQLAIQTEAKAFSQGRVDYINFHPAQPLPVLAPPDRFEDMWLTIRRNGHAVGTAPAGTVALVLERLAAKDIRFDLIVHALHGHAPETVAMIAEAARTRTNHFWLHDNFSICPGYTLMRNTIRYCGAPAPDSAACRICVFGQERPGHLARVKALFEAVDFTILAPSDSVRRLWQDRADLPAKAIRTHSHCTLATQVDAGSAPVPGDDPLRVAFIGMPGLHKGWPAWLDLVDALEDRAEIDFLSFGIKDPNDPRIRHTHVAVDRTDRVAMTTALHEARVDIAVLWSLCPETFSFAAYEALAAGALIVTHTDSGNIARLVQTEDAGWVLPDETALNAFFEQGQWHERIARRRQQAGPPRAAAFSDLTADILLRGGTT